MSGTRLAVFLCPSNTPPGWQFEGSGLLAAYTAPGNCYFASMGSSLEFSGDETGGPPNGPFQYDGPAIGIQNISDGTSNTIAFGEWKTGDGIQTVVTIPTDTVFLGSSPAGTTRNNGTLVMPNATLVASFLPWAVNCASLAGTDRTNQTSDLGRCWAFGLNSYTMGNTLLPPNPKYPNCSTVSVSSNAIQNPGMWGMSSYHPGGANVLLCDGSVRFLKDSTSMQTVWALGSARRRRGALRRLVLRGSRRTTSDRPGDVVERPAASPIPALGRVRGSRSPAGTVPRFRPTIRRMPIAIPRRAGPPMPTDRGPRRRSKILAAGGDRHGDVPERPRRRPESRGAADEKS